MKIHADEEAGLATMRNASSRQCLVQVLPGIPNAGSMKHKEKRKRQTDIYPSHSYLRSIQFTKRIRFEAVYTTISSDRHYRVNICFILLLIIFVTCFDHYLGHPQAYMNTWCQISELRHLFNMNSYCVHIVTLS
jgi:hypothetical protein